MHHPHLIKLVTFCFGVASAISSYWCTGNVSSIASALIRHEQTYLWLVTWKRTTSCLVVCGRWHSFYLHLLTLLYVCTSSKVVDWIRENTKKYGALYTVCFYWVLLKFNTLSYILWTLDTYNNHCTHIYFYRYLCNHWCQHVQCLPSDHIYAALHLFYR